MAGAITWRNEAIQRLTDRLSGRTTKHFFGGVVEEEHPLITIDGDNGIHRRTDNPCQARPALAQLTLGSRPLGNLGFQLAGVLQAVAVKGSVVVSDGHLCRHGDRQLLVLLAEGIHTELVRQACPAIDVFTHRQGRNQERSGAGQSFGQPQRGWSRGDIAETNCPALFHYGGEDAAFQQSCSQRRRIFQFEADNAQVSNLTSVAVQQHDQRPTGADDFPSHRTVAVEELHGITFPGEVCAQLNQRGQFSVRVA